MKLGSTDFGPKIPKLPNISHDLESHVELSEEKIIEGLTDYRGSLNGLNQDYAVMFKNGIEKKILTLFPGDKQYFNVEISKDGNTQDLKKPYNIKVLYKGNPLDLERPKMHN